MHLVSVRRLSGPVGHVRLASYPQLPLRLANNQEMKMGRWSQASSQRGLNGEQLIYLHDATDDEIQEVEAQEGATLVHVASQEELRDTKKRMEAFRDGTATPQFAVQSAATKARDWETTERTAIQAADIAAQLAFLENNDHFTLLHYSDFVYSNGSLHGLTMSDGTGTWTNSQGAGSYPKALSNHVVGDGANFPHSYEASIGMIGDQKAELTIDTNNSMGPAVRFNPAVPGFYFSDVFGGQIYLFSFNAPAGFTVLAGPAGAAITAGAVVDCQATGSSLSGHSDGVLIVGPATDSFYATGYPSITIAGVTADSACGTFASLYGPSNTIKRYRGFFAV